LIRQCIYGELETGLEVGKPLSIRSIAGTLSQVTPFGQSLRGLQRPIIASELLNLETQILYGFLRITGEFQSRECI
jgi:hypothetical protein